MSAATLIREAANAGVSIRLDGDKLALKAQVKPPGDLLDKIKASKPEIVALLRQAASPDARNSAVEGTMPDTQRGSVTASRRSPHSDAVKRAVEYHQCRIAAKEAAFASHGLGPDGKTPLAEYRRLAAEGAKTAKAIRDSALSAGHESLSKIINTPPPANGAWPEPKIAGNPPFGADHVPNRYQAGWQALLAGCPPWAAPGQWEMAIFSTRDLFAEWGAELLRLNWQPNDIFDRWQGVAWYLQGKHVTALGVRHAFLEDGRIFERAGR